MSKIGKDSQYSGGEFRRKVDKGLQKVLPGGRQNPIIKACHWAEHMYRAHVAEKEGDYGRAEAERQRARSNSPGK